MVLNRTVTAIRHASKKQIGAFTIRHPSKAKLDDIVRFEAENFYTTGSDFIGTLKYGNIGQFVSDQAIADKLHYLHEHNPGNISYAEDDATGQILSCFTRYVGKPGEIKDPNEYHVIWPEKLNFEIAYNVGLFRLMELLPKDEPWVHIHTLTVHREARGAGGLTKAMTADYNHKWPSDYYHHIGMATSEIAARLGRDLLPEHIPRDSVHYINELDYETFVESNGNKVFAGKTNKVFQRCYLTDAHVYPRVEDEIRYSATG